jgi:hypothetical protein
LSVYNSTYSLRETIVDIIFKSVEKGFLMKAVTSDILDDLPTSWGATLYIFSIIIFSSTFKVRYPVVKIIIQTTNKATEDRYGWMSYIQIRRHICTLCQKNNIRCNKRLTLGDFENDCFFFSKNFLEWIQTLLRVNFM